MDRPVKRPASVESTALGAAYLAGLAVGFWGSKEEVMRNIQYDRVFIPSIDPEEEQQSARDGPRLLNMLTDGLVKED